MAAFDLAGTLAGLDLDEATIRRILAERLTQAAMDRTKGVQNSQQAISNNGLLHSSIAAQDVARVNTSADTQIAGMQADSNQDYARIGQQRVNAQNAYQEYLKKLAAETAAKTPVITETAPEIPAPAPVAAAPEIPAYNPGPAPIQAPRQISSPRPAPIQAPRLPTPRPPSIWDTLKRPATPRPRVQANSTRRNYF